MTEQQDTQSPTPYMQTVNRLRPLVDQILALPFEEKTTLAMLAGLKLACCPGCGCYVGKPDCHDEEMAERMIDVDGEHYGGMCEGCKEFGECSFCGAPLDQGGACIESIDDACDDGEDDDA